MNWTGLYTLYRKETLRFLKVYLQTLLAPIVTTLLYLIVFSHVLSGRKEVFEGTSYVAFLVPGLVMMSVLQNAFANSSSSLIQSKVTGNILFVLVTPLTYLEIFLAFTAAAITRGILVGAGVLASALLFTSVTVDHPAVVIVFTILGSGILAVLGIIAGIWAEKFDQVAGFTNFIIVPLSFLSGVFYSIHSLPDFWQQLSVYNPFFYVIDGFRFGFFGQSDVDIRLSLAVVCAVFAALSLFTLALLKSGYRLRS